MEQKKEEDSVAIAYVTFPVGKCIFSPSMCLSNYVAEKIVDRLTIISDSLTEADDYCAISEMVKSFLHHWVRIFLSMEIDIQYFLVQKQGQQLQEVRARIVEDSPTVDKITDHLLMDGNTDAKSVCLYVLKNAIESSVTLLHRKGGKYSLLSRQLALMYSSDSKTFQCEKTHQRKPNKTMAAAAPTTSTSAATSFSLFDLLDKNPQLYNNRYSCNSAALIDKIVKSYNCHKLQIFQAKNVMETWIEEIVKELEEMNYADSDFVNHPDWSTIEEILLLGLGCFTSQLDVKYGNTNHSYDNEESPITNLPIRYLQVHRSLIQSLVHSAAIEEDCNTTIVAICGLLSNLLQTLNEIFYSRDNNSTRFVLVQGQTSFSLSTPLEKLVGQIILTSHFVAKDVLLPYLSHYTISSFTQQRLEEITLLLFALYRADTSCQNKWGLVSNHACSSFQLLPSHLFASIDPYATLLDMWIRQLGPQSAWRLLMSSNLRNDLFKYISSALNRSTTTRTKFTQFPSSGPKADTYGCYDISSTSLLIPISSSHVMSKGNIKRSIHMLNDQNDGAGINYTSVSLLSRADYSATENYLSIIDLENALFIWTLHASRSLICMFRLSIFIDFSSNDTITDEVASILTSYLSILKVGVTIQEDQHEENLVQLCSDVVETVLNVFRPNSVTNAIHYGPIYYYIAQELTALILASHDIFSNPFSLMCLRVLHHLFEEPLSLMVRLRSNMIDLRHSIVSQVIGLCHTFFNNQCTTSIPNSSNILDNSKKMEKFILIVSLLGSAIHWSGTIENLHHSVITTSLHNFVKCASYLGLRREAYVTIATTFGREQYSGETIIERLAYVEDCINFALEEFFLVMTVSNNHDVIIEENRGASKLLHTVVSICHGTKNGGKVLVKNPWFQRLFACTLPCPKFENNEQTMLARLEIPVMLLALGGVWSYNAAECNEIFEILENFTRTTLSSVGSSRDFLKWITSFARLNVDVMFSLLHRSLKPSTKDSDDRVQPYVSTSSAALLLAQLNETIIGTYDAMKGHGGVHSTKVISQKSTTSINNMSHAASFIRELENARTTASPKEVCLSFSSLMTAEFLGSIDLISATEAALFAPRMNGKSCQQNYEGSSGLNEFYGTVILFLKSMFQFGQIDLSVPDNFEEGICLFLGVSKNGQVFIDWLGIIVYALCCGDISKACDAIQILQDKPGIQILWPRIRLENGCNICLVSFLAEEILQMECPEVLTALEQSGCPLSIIICAWQTHCFIGVLSLGEALLLQCISLLHGVDYLVYYAVCIIIHMKKSILVTAANKNLLSLSCLSATDFRVAASFQCATKLCCKYRELIFSLDDEIGRL